MKKQRCSIAFCPWRAKYSFGLKGYYECWFHGGDAILVDYIWGILSYPIRAFYHWIKCWVYWDKCEVWICLPEWNWKRLKEYYGR